jgi:hypothetical protein
MASPLSVVTVILRHHSLQYASLMPVGHEQSEKRLGRRSDARIDSIGLLRVKMSGERPPLARSSITSGLPRLSGHTSSLPRLSDHTSSLPRLSDQHKHLSHLRTTVSRGMLTPHGSVEPRQRRVYSSALFVKTPSAQNPPPRGWGLMQARFDGILERPRALACRFGAALLEQALRPKGKSLMQSHLRAPSPAQRRGGTDCKGRPICPFCVSGSLRAG